MQQQRKSGKIQTKATGTQSIERAASLLRAVSIGEPQGASVLEIARRIGLERPTVHRIAKCLAVEGLLRFDEAKHRYHLGHLAYELGLAAAPSLNLREICQPALSRIAEMTGDTAILTVRSGIDTICLDRQVGAYPVKALTVEVGSRRPLGTSAGSIALLAALPDAEMERVVMANAGRYSHYGKLTVPTVLELAYRARALGYALNYNDIIIGVAALGVVVPNALGTPVIALGTAAISSRLSKDRQKEIVTLLCQEAKGLADVTKEVAMAWV